MLNILYFAGLRERLGCAGEELELPAGVTDIAGLLSFLSARGGRWESLVTTRNLRFALNQEMARLDSPLGAGDEVAFSRQSLAVEMVVRVQQEDFDVGAELALLRRDNPRIGALVSFVGLVREVNEGVGVSEMTLEHYPGMTEKALDKIVAEARRRWVIIDALVIHRIGCLLPTDQIVLVAVAGRHRGEAFAACEFIIDYLKTRAPFWKREVTPQGVRWVDAHEIDDRAAERWQD